jgi:hypothetical protein
MAVEVETRRGRCATHGSVEATKELPQLQFPYLYNWVRRLFANRHPFWCPTCNQPVETD